MLLSSQAFCAFMKNHKMAWRLQNSGVPMKSLNHRECLARLASAGSKHILPISCCTLHPRLTYSSEENVLTRHPRSIFPSNHFHNNIRWFNVSHDISDTMDSSHSLLPVFNDLDLLSKSQTGVIEMGLDWKALILSGCTPISFHHLM